MNSVGMKFFKLLVEIGLVTDLNFVPETIVYIWYQIN
jgi:hypothetical protein